MPTFTLSSTEKTGQYSRTLPVYNTAPSTTVYNQYIATAADVIAKTATNRTVNAMVLGSGSAYVDSVTAGDYISNNKTSGSTFLVFNKVRLIQGVNLNVGPNNGSGSNQDGPDSIYIETGDHSTNSTTTAVSFIGSSITTGDETSPLNDNDLVVFGSDKVQDGSPDYVIQAGPFKATIPKLLAPGSVQAPLVVQSSNVQTGNGDDSLIFANTVLASKIGGTAGEGNTFDVGEGADLVYFATPSQIYGNNVINIGKKNGTSDAQADNIVFNGTNFANLNGTSTFITIKGFQNTVDSVYYNGTQYQNSTNVTTASSGKIRFA